MSGRHLNRNLRLLEEMRLVLNIEQIVDQIDAAATMATSFMRQNGWTLRLGSKDVPLQTEVDDHLRRGVAEAYAAFLETKREAMADGNTPADTEIEGYGGDGGLFDVVLTGMPLKPGFLTIQVFFRLV